MAGCAFLLLAAASARAEGPWPSLSSPARSIGGGEHDAAVVVGVESYFAVPGIPGAKSNAGQWYDYLTETRGVRPENVKLLTDADATREEILDASRRAAGRAGAKGTLWFVFIGHGAPSADGKDGLLVGVDAQQKAESLQTRSVRQSELLKALTASPAGSIRVVLDACFSGRGPDGATIAPGLQPLLTVSGAGAADPRLALLTAAKGNQFAGALPGESRPAFSYLVLGGLRGWAAGADGKVTAGSLLSYARGALSATLRGRDQTPDLIGPEGAVMAASAGEQGPNLAKLAKATSGGGALQFSVSALPAVPKAASLPSMSAVGMPRALRPADLGQAQGIDFGAVDVDALGKYDEAVRFEKGSAPPKSKASKWRELGAEVKAYEDLAAKRAVQWDDFAEQDAFNAVLENDKTDASPEVKALKWKALSQTHPKFAQTAGRRAQEWELYAAELAAEEEAKDKRAELRDRDWIKLSKLLSFSVVGPAEKTKFAQTFVSAYGSNSQDNPYVAELAPYLPPGSVKVVPGARAPAAGQGKAGIEWVKIPGGAFVMGAVDAGADALPRHDVAIKTFFMAKTPVTVAQYKACVDLGACAAPGTGGDCNWGIPGREKHPVNCVDWGQARKFSEWAGGRLPTEAEWEFAARGGGREQRYPWGDGTPTCERAVSSDCGEGTAPVCSAPAGVTKHGLCDMAGNVRQWVADGYHDSYEGAPADGRAWENTETASRVDRGGSWGFDAQYLRSSVRFFSAEGDRHGGLGFRPARAR